MHSSCAGNQKVKIANGSFSTIAGKGSVISSNLVLQNVLHVPQLFCNLLSINTLTIDLNCRAHFSKSDCQFQDLNLSKTTGNAKQVGALYFLEDGNTSKRLS